MYIDVYWFVIARHLKVIFDSYKPDDTVVRTSVQFLSTVFKVICNCWCECTSLPKIDSWYSFKV